MDFGIPQPRRGFCVTEICPTCLARLVITEQRIITENRDITCKVCNTTFKLNINKTKE